MQRSLVLVESSVLSLQQLRCMSRWEFDSGQLHFVIKRLQDALGGHPSFDHLSKPRRTCGCDPSSSLPSFPFRFFFFPKKPRWTKRMAFSAYVEKSIKIFEHLFHFVPHSGLKIVFAWKKSVGNRNLMGEKSFLMFFT